MARFRAHVAKFLLLPVLAGTFCLGLFLHAPAAQAMENKHESIAFTVSADCCGASQMDHETEAVSAVPLKQISHARVAFVLPPVFFSPVSVRGADQVFITD